MLREARKQNGIGWNEERCMIQAEPHLWDNLEVVSYFVLTNSSNKFVHKFSCIDIHFILLLKSFGRGSRNSEKMDTFLCMIN
jgi:hypothetical protein